MLPEENGKTKVTFLFANSYIFLVNSFKFLKHDEQMVMMIMILILTMMMMMVMMIMRMKIAKQNRPFCVWRTKSYDN